MIKTPPPSAPRIRRFCAFGQNVAIRVKSSLFFLVIVAALAPVGIYRLVIQIAGGASTVPNAAALKQINATGTINSRHANSPFRHRKIPFSLYPIIYDNKAAFKRNFDKTEISTKYTKTA